MDPICCKCFPDKNILNLLMDICDHRYVVAALGSLARSHLGSSRTSHYCDRLSGKIILVKYDKYDVCILKKDFRRASISRTGSVTQGNVYFFLTFLIKVKIF